MQRGWASGNLRKSSATENHFGPNRACVMCADVCVGAPVNKLLRRSAGSFPNLPPADADTWCVFADDTRLSASCGARFAASLPERRVRVRRDARGGIRAILSVSRGSDLTCYTLSPLPLPPHLLTPFLAA